MPDLRTDTVRSWLEEIRTPGHSLAWPPAIRPVEVSAQASSLLGEFGALLDQQAEHNAVSLAAFLQQDGHLEDLQQVLAQLGAARALSFFHWLRQTGLPDHLRIEKALLDGDAPAPRALFATITTVARQATLRRLISVERMDELLSATDTANKERHDA